MQVLTRTFFVFALLAAATIVVSQGAVTIHLHGRAVCSDEGGVATVTSDARHNPGGTRVTCQSGSSAGNGATAFDRARYHLVF